MQGSCASGRGSPFGPAYDYLPQATANSAGLPATEDPDYLPYPRVLARRPAILGEVSVVQPHRYSVPCC